MTWQYGYDAMGRPTTVLDPDGLASYTYYDSLGRPVQTQQPANTGSATPISRVTAPIPMPTVTEAAWQR
jgi:YD repeat-containing protein